MNVVASEPNDPARERLLRAAEILFSTKGLDQVTMRELTTKAKTNIAAVNYYFGSKAGMIEAVFDHLARRVNKERLRKLEAYLEAVSAQNKRPDLPVILENFLEPYLDGTGNGRLLARLILQNRVAPTTFTRNLIKRHFDPLARRHVDALVLACPGMSRSECVWRYSFMIGTVVLPLTENDSRIHRLSDKQADASDRDAMKQALLRFLQGAMSGR